jgi:putative addiction module killer protein
MYRIASTFKVETTREFEAWLAALKDRVGKACIVARITRLRYGHFGNSHSVGGKIAELVIDVGPGYRVYFTRTGKTIVLLLCGGDKSTQTSDIKRAHSIANRSEK